MKPSTGGFAKKSLFRATDARYASASLVEMQKSPHLEPPFKGIIMCDSNLVQGIASICANNSFED